ncbi:hypothetical protein [Longispora urticae]
MKRFLAGAALTTLAASTLTLGLGTAAHAKVTPADLAVDIKARQIAVDSNGKTFFVEVQNKGGSTATHTKVVFDMSKLGPNVVADLPGWPCTGDRTAYVCDLGELEPGYLDSTLGVNLRPVSPDAPLGRAGKLTVSISSDYREDVAHKGDNSTTYSVDLMASSIDYGVLVGNVGGLAPGVPSDLWIAVDNNGTQTGAGLSLALTLPEHVVFSEEVRGCSYTNKRSAVCAWSTYIDSDGTEQPIVLAPGASFDTLALGLRVQATADATPNTNLGAAVVQVGPYGDFQPEAGTARGAVVKQAKVAAKQVDGDKVDNSARFTLTTGTPYSDLALSGATVTGKVGEVVDYKVTVTNNGAWASPKTSKIIVTAPEGTKFATPPKPCHTIISKVSYECTLPTLVGGESYDLALSLRFSQEVAGVSSTNTVTGTLPDPVDGNNSAIVTATATK